MAMEDIDQLALDRIEQPHLTTLGGRGHQSAIRRHSQMPRGGSARNPPRRLGRMPQIIECDFVVTGPAPFEDDDQHLAPHGKDDITHLFSSGDYHLSGFDVPNTEEIAASP